MKRAETLVSRRLEDRGPYLWELAGVGGLLALLYALWFTVASPVGEFPINDDWAYAFSVRHLLETGQLKLSQWTSSSIIFQVFLGSAVAWSSGGFTFTALRLTTLAVSFLGGLAAYDLFRQLRLPSSAALLGTLVIVTNPIFMYLSYTFMADIYFLTMMFASVSLYTRGVTTSSRRMLLAGSVAAALAYLSRQLGMFLPAAAAIALVLKQRRLSWPALWAIGLIPAVVILTHVTWLRFVHGFPWALQARAIDQSLAKLLTPGAALTLLHHALVTLLYLGMFTLPALAARVARSGLPREQRLRLSVAFGVWLVILGVFVYAARVEMPHLSGTIKANGLGLVPPDKPQITPGWVYWLATIVAPVAGALQGALWTDAVATAWRDRAGPGVTLIVASVFMAMMTSIAVILWDKYLLVFVPAALYLALRPGPVNLRQWMVALPILAAIVIYGTLEMGDHMAWNAARWSAAQKLVARGERPERIDAGFEWTGWHEFEDKAPKAIAAGQTSITYWPAFTAKKTHVLRFTGLADYMIVGEEPYRTPVLGRRGMIYVLFRETPLP